MRTSGLAWRALTRSGEKCTGVSLEDKRQLRIAKAVAPLQRDEPNLRKTCSEVPSGGLEVPWPIVLGNCGLLGERQAQQDIDSSDLQNSEEMWLSPKDVQYR